MATTTLALIGGTPIRRATWPTWPPVDAAIRSAAVVALDSGRWSISGPSRGAPPIQQRFERSWAEFTGVGHAVAVSSGSSALVLAMEALDIGPGDEVIVPVWTWVATASTVLRVGATPVLVDVDPTNFCLAPVTVEAAVTPRTRAVIVVHLHQSMADMVPMHEMTRRKGLFLIEDAAQAHGAMYDGGRAGSFGDIAAFSFQQTKVLTSGEGGVVVTNNDDLARRVFELHADGRRWSLPHAVSGLELAAGTGPMGANHGLSEIQAAMLLAQLPGLDAKLSHAAEQAEQLDGELVALGLRPLEHPDRLRRRTVFEYIVSFDPGRITGVPIDLIGQALTAETGTPWYPSDPPLHTSPLYRPASKRRFAEAAGRVDDGRSFPVADRYSACSLACHHSALLADDRAMDDIVRAFDKVLNNLDELSAWAAVRPATS